MPPWLDLRRWRRFWLTRPSLWKGSWVLDILAQWHAEDAEKLHQKRLREEAGIIDQPHECGERCKRITSSPAMDSDKLADLCWSEPAKYCEKYLKKLARDLKADRIQALQYDRELENVTRLMEKAAVEDEMDIHYETGVTADVYAQKGRPHAECGPFDLEESLELAAQMMYRPPTNVNKMQRRKNRRRK